MKIKYLHAFLAIAKTGQITKAAQALFISQPALSANIKAFEEDIKVALFERTPEGMKLTKKGEVLLPEAEKIIKAIEDFERLAKGDDKAIESVFLGLPSDASLGQIGSFIAEYKQQNSHIRVELCECRSGDILDKIHTESIDAGFVIGPIDDEDIVQYPINRYTLSVAAPIAYAEQLKNIDNWQALAQLPWIYTSKNCGHYRALKHVFESRKLAMPKQYVTADSSMIALNFLQHDSGVTLMPTEEAKKAEQQGLICIWEGHSIAIELSFVYRQQHQTMQRMVDLTAAVKQFWALS